MSAAEIRRSSRRTNSLTVSIQSSSSKNEIKDDPQSPHTIEFDKPDLGELTPRTLRLSNFAPNSQTNSPRFFPNNTQTSPEYIFLNRKKVIDILMADNIVRESQNQKIMSLPSSPRSIVDSPSRNSLRTSEIFNQGPKSPGKTNHRFSIFSPQAEEVQNQQPPSRTSIRMSIFSPSVENSSPITKLSSLKTRFEDIKDELDRQQKYQEKLLKFNPISPRKFESVKEELEKAQKFQEKLQKFNPMSAKSLVNHEGFTKNKMIRIVKKHHHRLFGMDPLNLKKINQLLTATKESTPSHTNLPPLNHSEDSDGALSRKNSHFNFKESEPDFLAAEEDVSPKIADYQVYGYNPLNDNFEITDQAWRKMNINIQALVSPTNGRKVMNKPKKSIVGIDWEMKDTLPDYKDQDDSIVETDRSNQKTIRLPRIEGRKHDYGDYGELFITQKDKSKSEKRKDSKPKHEKHEGGHQSKDKEEKMNVLRQVDPKSLGVKELDELCRHIEMQNRKLTKGFRRQKSIRTNSIA